MNNDTIRKLAKITGHQKAIDQKTFDLVMKSFNRKQLLLYLMLLKKEIEQNCVRVFSSMPLSTQIKNDIEGLFVGKEIIFHIDPELTDGIRVQINDTIIDLSAKAYIEEAINQLKE